MKRRSNPTILMLALTALVGSTALALSEDAHHPNAPAPSAGTQTPVQPATAEITPRTQAPAPPVLPPAAGQESGASAKVPTQSSSMSCHDIQGTVQRTRRIGLPDDAGT